MKNFKGFALGLVLGLAISGIGLAQNVTQGAQKKEGQSCCAMMSGGCCKGDSCDMKLKHDQKASATKGCCCCDGDSCDMKMNHDMPEKPRS